MIRKLSMSLVGLCATFLVACNGGANGQTLPQPKQAGSISAQFDGIVYNNATGKKLDFCKVPDGVPVRSVAIVFIHGGGFKSGNRGQMKGYCELFARGGFTSVTIDYRLSGEAAYPAAVDDVNGAISWLKAAAPGEGFSSSKIALVGYSAGGSLALMAGKKAPLKPAGRVSVAGITDFRAAIDETPHAALKRDLRAFLGDADPLSVSPIEKVNADVAPVFFFHGKKDNIVPVMQSVRMAKKLESNGVKQLLRIYDDAGHEIMLGGPNLKPLLQDLTAFLIALDEQS